jgi:acetamidase/formamidase
VRGAEPGDVLEVRILDIHARRGGNSSFPGRAFGSNAAARFYALDAQPSAEGSACARAVYNFRRTPQRDPLGVMHPSLDYPGVPVDHPTVVENHGILMNVRIPVRPHFGLIAVAPGSMA